MDDAQPRRGLSAHVLPLLIALSTLTALAPRGARAQVSPEHADTYREASRLVEVDAERALTLATSLPDLSPVDDMRVKLVADSALAAGRVDLAIPNLLDYAGRTRSSQDAFRARLEAAELAVLANDATQARALLDALEPKLRSLTGRYATRRHLSARVIRLLHDLDVAQDQTRDASRRARQLLLLYPNETATRRPGLQADPASLSDRDRFVRAKAFYRAWAYHDAREVFATLTDSTSYGESARWHLAQIALNKLRDDFPEAERLFGKLSKSGAYKQESLYQYARAQMRQERYDECLANLDRYVRLYPRGDRVNMVYYYRGWLPYDHRDNDTAIRELKKYISRYGRKSGKSSYIYGFLAWTYMREARWKEAIAAWEAMLPFGNPLVAGKAYYWMAHAHHELGDDDAAFKSLDRLRKRYPLTYYGVHGEMLRARLEGEVKPASQVWWPDRQGAYDDTPRVDVDTLRVSALPSAARARWARVRALVALGERRAARETFSPIYQTVLRVTPAGKRAEWIHALGHYVGDYNKMWRAATGSTISYVPPAPDSDELRSVMAYPRAYGDVVADVAAEFELPEYLLWSIMRQESRYKPSAISHTDAVGALQMIPKTARKVARDLGITYNPRTFHHPEVGFRFSAFYMRKLLDTFSGLLTPMAGSYNSGPDVIARWFKRNPDASFPWLIEEFEYNEGRAYSRKVTEHMTRYVYLYEKDPARLAQLVDQLYPLSRDIEIPEDVGY